MELLEDRKSVSNAIEDVEYRERNSEDLSGRGADLHLIASGGYNDVWLVPRPLMDASQYILRKPKEGSLLPDQLRNEIAWLTFARKNLKNVPVPRVYTHSLLEDGPKTHYLAEEYVEGHCLSSVWTTYDEHMKMQVAHHIAKIVVELGETTFEGIGGLMLDHKLGPTVEGMKIFKGRVSQVLFSLVCLNLTIPRRTDSILQHTMISDPTKRPGSMCLPATTKRYITIPTHRGKTLIWAFFEKSPWMTLSRHYMMSGR